MKTRSIGSEGMSIDSPAGALALCIPSMFLDSGLRRNDEDFLSISRKAPPLFARSLKAQTRGGGRYPVLANESGALLAQSQSSSDSDVDEGAASVWVSRGGVLTSALGLASVF